MSRVFSVAVEGSSRIFRLPKRAIFDNEDSKATRFAEIDARAFLKAQHGNRTRRVSNRPQYSGKQWFWTQSNAKHSACGGPPTLFHTFGCWRPALTGMFLVWGTNYTWLRSRPNHTPLYFFTFKILLGHFFTFKILLGRPVAPQTNRRHLHDFFPTSDRLSTIYVCRLGCCAVESTSSGRWEPGGSSQVATNRRCQNSDVDGLGLRHLSVHISTSSRCPWKTQVITVPRCVLPMPRIACSFGYGEDAGGLPNSAQLQCNRRFLNCVSLRAGRVHHCSPRGTGFARCLASQPGACRHVCRHVCTDMQLLRVVGRLSVR